MTPYPWQESWDRQQESYLPDREERFAAMLDTVDAVADGQPKRILDLAGGTGSISLRALRRFRDVEVTLLDLDPVLLTIARASLAGRATIATANLGTPDWVAALPHRDFDAVLTATALHWLQPDRLAALYAEIRTVLRPAGVFVNADHMPEGNLPELTERLSARTEARRQARHAAGVMLSWRQWWDHVAADATLGPLVRERKRLFGELHVTDWNPPVSWHLDALRTAGFRETGLVWRGTLDAAVAALR